MLKKTYNPKLSRQILSRKIIQFPLNLPPPNQETISNILFERINSILDIYPKSKDTFDKNRWIYIHESCLKNYINNIRSLNRYISTLAFHSKHL
ncbi:P-loop NTPase fold protein [Aliamphritea spongicola]